MTDVEIQTARPNIIVILVDDMGFSDIGCYGSEIRTPNLDRLAEGGVRFTQMYNCARCCPTRASLLTGLYPHQAGVGHMVNDRGFPAYQGYLNKNCVTIAEALGKSGYRTLMSGKWHVGGNYNPAQPKTWYPGEPTYPMPTQRGFDHHYGTYAGGGSYFNPPTLSKNGKFIEIETEEYYYTDAISIKASEMIESAVRDEKPFFLYTAYTAPHWPLQAIPEDIAHYEGVYRLGWDDLRIARHETLKSMGIVNDKWEISPRDEKAFPWNEISHQVWEDLRMATYSAQIDRMDQGVGTILNKLDELKITDNTLIMFLSDNGGCAEFLAEDGGRKSRFRYDIPTRDGKPMRIGNTPNILPGPSDTFMSYDLSWANASNTPFRLYKHWVHEGGISTPFIVKWPSKTLTGEIIHSPAHVIDIMATCLEAAEISYPLENNGSPVLPLQGESLIPAFTNVNWNREDKIFWEHEGNRAVRDRNWKLVSKFPGDWELYNMEQDRTENNDISIKNKNKADEMKFAYNQWAEHCAVVPWETMISSSSSG